MSLKYFFLYSIITLNAYNNVVIHPHYSNRIIDNHYEWDLSYKASTLFQELLENYRGSYTCTVTPFAYTKLSSYEKISFINTQQPTYCIILSLYHYDAGLAAVRLYYPTYEQLNTHLLSFSDLSFIPYQYGYRKSHTKTAHFITSFQSNLKLLGNMIEILPFKKAPLKIGIGVTCPTVLIEIGINSVSTLETVLPIIAQALNILLQEEL